MVKGFCALQCHVGLTFSVSHPRQSTRCANSSYGFKRWQSWRLNKHGAKRDIQDSKAALSPQTGCSLGKKGFVPPDLRKDVLHRAVSRRVIQELLIARVSVLMKPLPYGLITFFGSCTRFSPCGMDMGNVQLWGHCWGNEHAVQAACWCLILPGFAWKCLILPDAKKGQEPRNINHF